MPRIPPPEAFEFLRTAKLSRSTFARQGSGNKVSRGWGSASEVQGIKTWDETSTRMASVASGRLGYPVAIETPRESLSEIFCLIDGRSCLNFGSQTQTILERNFTLGLVLALVALGDGWRVHPLIFEETGLSALPVCSKTGDWFALHQRLTDWSASFKPDSPLSTFPRQWLTIPGFLICSDAEAVSSPLMQFLPLVRNLVGRIRVYDPWEKTPPKRGLVSLWGPSKSGRENWLNPGFRKDLEKAWIQRDQKWEQAVPGHLPPLTHSTGEDWKSVLDPWMGNLSRGRQ